MGRPCHDSFKCGTGAGTMLTCMTGFILFQVVDGYFVHFFAPTGLQVGDKAIVFILDVSGSMRGI